MAGVSVLGAGSWGTSLAILLARNGQQVCLWGHDRAHLALMASERCNARYLPGIPFPANVEIQDSLPDAARASEILLVAVPSHAFQSLLESIRPHIPGNVRIAWATKGLELETGRLLHEVVATIFGSETPAAVLSGPSFAREVATGQPTAITVASKFAAFASELVSLLHGHAFRPYTTDDVIGVELGGAIKNVLAIAAGVADGLGYGANARAALITRGLAEMMRLGVALGGRPETLMGLSGVGDLILTCTDNQSRNRRFGVGLGQGESPASITARIGQEIEGITTSRIVYQLAMQRGIDMPITTQIHRILHEGLSPAEAVSNLLLREPKAEREIH